MTTRLPPDAIDTPAAQRVLAVLSDAGFQALFVGGTVRNALLGSPVTDFDIATDALPEDVVTLAEAADIRCVPTGVAHGTVTLVVDGAPFEVTTFRRDIETDGRHAVVSFSKDVAQDARRRDFTMNALYADASGTVIDPLGGLQDLLDRRVRFVGIPEDRIREDYLRILRFFRFSAHYAYPESGIDADGLAACAAHLDGLGQLSAERVWAELKKLLGAPDPAWVVGSMEMSGVLTACLTGTSAVGIAQLVHAEAQLDLPPDPLRRFVALGGDTPETNLRLSRSDARYLAQMRTAVASTDGPLVLGHDLGPAAARDVLALRFALLQSLFSKEDVALIDKGAAAIFPVRAADLRSDLEGADIGAALAKLKAIWLAERCEPSKSDLLRHL